MYSKITSVKIRSCRGNFLFKEKRLKRIEGQKGKKWKITAFFSEFVPGEKASTISTSVACTSKKSLAYEIIK